MRATLAAFPMPRIEAANARLSAAAAARSRTSGAQVLLGGVLGLHGEVASATAHDASTSTGVLEGGTVRSADIGTAGAEPTLRRLRKDRSNLA